MKSVSEVPIAGDGGRIDCWKMQHEVDALTVGKAIQYFWISKRSKEVLKEEDQLPTANRYKLKIGISGEGETLKN